MNVSQRFESFVGSRELSCEFNFLSVSLQVRHKQRVHIHACPGWSSSSTRCGRPVLPPQAAPAVKTRRRRHFLWSSSYKRAWKQTGKDQISWIFRWILDNPCSRTPPTPAASRCGRGPEWALRRPTLLSSTRLWAGLPSSSRVSAAGPSRVSGSRRPRQPADRPLRQKTVKGMEVWRARCNTHTHTHTFTCAKAACALLTVTLDSGSYMSAPLRWVGLTLTLCVGTPDMTSVLLTQLDRLSPWRGRTEPGFLQLCTTWNKPPDRRSFTKTGEKQVGESSAQGRCAAVTHRLGHLITVGYSSEV